ncbi:MAG: Hsp20/alpha crystallin family protein [Polyangiaceae bacterium]|nr:Hsp20/alpha crystallin family protein [Polyangiaceae bacterium]
MFHYVPEFDSTFSLLNQLRRQMDRAIDDLDRTGRWPAEVSGYPAINLYDDAARFILTADLPGHGADEVKVTLNQDVLTLVGERKNDAPEGYSVHRQERTPVRFSRSLKLPSRVDPEKVEATLENGVLRVSVEKAAEVQPRKITVRAS